MKEKPGYRAMVESKFNELLSLLYKRTQSRPPSKRQAGSIHYEKCIAKGEPLAVGLAKSLKLSKKWLMGYFYANLCILYNLNQ